jgi:glycosyltransferase involved in cell wall biosynthesis
MPGAYAAADALVIPSDARETWGLVVNEAMAAGLPVVASDAVGCGPDLVRPGETGAVVRCGAMDELADALLDLARDPARRQALGAGARRLVGRYSVAEAVAGTLAAIDAVRRGPGARRVARPAVHNALRAAPERLPRG